MKKLNWVKEKFGVISEWCMRHWVFIIIGASVAYVTTMIIKMFKDDGIGADGKPYYSSFASAEEQEGKDEEKE